MLAIACTATALLQPSSVYADTTAPSASTAVDINVYVDPVISIRALDSTGTTDITAVNVDVIPTDTGAFAKNSLILQVDSSNHTGYNLYASSDYKTDGTTSETDPATAAEYTNSLVNLTQSDTIPTLSATQSSPITESAFSATSSTYQNQWGMSKAWNETISGTALSGGSLTSYFGVPVHGTTITLRDDVDTTSNNSRTNIGVGVNVNTAKKAGTYQNQFVFTAVGNPLPVDYTLTFDKNTDATVANLPEPMTDTVIAQSKTFTIPNTTPTREGYQFIGWSRSATEIVGTGTGPASPTDPTQHLYVAGDSFTVLSDDQSGSGTTTRFTGSATLYAIWEEDVSCLPYTICYQPNGADVEGEMPNQTEAYLNSADDDYKTDTITSSTTEFTLYAPNFSRTGYGFAGWNTKADGTGTMFGPNQTLTTSDSTLTSAMQSELGSNGLIFYAIWVPSAGDLQTWTGCSSLISGQVTALTDSRDSQTYAVAKLADNKCWTIENMRYKPIAGTETTSFSTDDSTFYQQYSLTNIDRTLDPLAVSSQGSPYYQWYSYGGQYSWLSAINSSSNVTSGDVSTSICPTGWRLPTSDGTTKDFPALQNALNGTTGDTYTFTSSNNWRKYPNNFVFAGLWIGANAYDRGTYGNYWSSSVEDSNFAYSLGFDSTSVGPVDGNDKSRGFSVRCVYSAD